MELPSHIKPGSNLEKQEERVFLFKVIKMYESLPALWKVKSKEYTDRIKKSKAYDKLLEVYRERYPNATREDVARKINSLRTNFRKELRKTNELKKSGTDYESTLWYFNTLKFLIDEETATEVNDSGNIHEEECKDSVQEFLEINVAENDVCKNAVPPKKKRIIPKDTLDDSIRLACNRVQESVPDEELLVATTWATELMKMAPQQQLFAKKFINDILFEGQMGTLHRGSIVINQLERISSPRSNASASSFWCNG